MRFGLSDLDELPSLKEFEQLARAALGTDEGIAPNEPEADSGAEPLTRLTVIRPSRVADANTPNASQSSRFRHPPNHLLKIAEPGSDEDGDQESARYGIRSPRREGRDNPRPRLAQGQKVLRRQIHA